MSALRQINFIIGFVAIFIAACFGAFVANEITNNLILKLSEQNHSWFVTMLKSSHGHTNLFGMLHILFGLTLPFSGLSLRVQKYQTIGLLLGTGAMSLGLAVQAFWTPSDEITVLNIAIGIALSAALVSIGGHIYGLFLKLRVS